jgi:hypothetical protein
VKVARAAKVGVRFDPGRATISWAVQP